MSILNFYASFLMLHTYSARFKTYFIRAFITLFTLNILIVSVLFFVGIRLSDDRQMIYNEKSQEREILIEKSIIQNFLDEIVLDLNVLTHVAHMTGIYSGSVSPAISQEAFTQIIRELFSQKTKYKKYCLTDLTGKLTSRFQLENDHFKIDSRDKLQNQINLIDFNETVKLDSGMFYISPLELSLKAGKIDIPYMPEIRICAPVFDGKAKVGICVLTIDGADLLRKISLHTWNIVGIQYLINSEGYFLAGQDTSFLWGYMFPDKKDRTVKRAFPTCYPQIMTTENGQFRTEQGLFTVSSVYPFQIEGSELKNMIVPSNYSWKIISLIPDENLALASVVNIDKLVFFYLLFIMVGFVVSWLVARILTQKVQSYYRMNESEEIMNMTLTQSEAGVWDFNLVSKKLIYHKSWYKMLGYDENETKPSVELLSSLLHPDDKPAVSKAFNDYISGKADKYEITYRLLTNGGNWKWILDRGKIIETDREGRLCGSLGCRLILTGKNNPKMSCLSMKVSLKLFLPIWSSEFTRRPRMAQLWRLIRHFVPCWVFRRLKSLKE